VKQILRVFGGLLMTAALWVHPASAKDQPVLVELYTSQGCSSCPDADVLFQDLVKRPGIVGLAFHVDYWDYIGWQDIFARAEYTLRQKSYAKRHGAKMVYTPQVVVQGREFVVGSKPMDVAQAVKTQSHNDTGVNVRLTRGAGGVSVSITGTPPAQVAKPVVYVAEFIPSQQVSIQAGENAGRVWTYTNIVTRLTPLAPYSAPKFEQDLTGFGDHIAVFVQGADHGPVLAADITR
jgi:hypothetical protein